MNYLPRVVKLIRMKFYNFKTSQSSKILFLSSKVYKISEQY